MALAVSNRLVRTRGDIPATRGPKPAMVARDRRGAKRLFLAASDIDNSFTPLQHVKDACPYSIRLAS